jgi:hypothetical protein
MKEILFCLVATFTFYSTVVKAQEPSNPPTFEELKRDHPLGLYNKFQRLEFRKNFISTRASSTTDEINKKEKKQNRFNNRIKRLYRFTIDDKNLIDTAVITFVGNGNIQKSFTEGVSIPTSTGVGINYSELWKKPKFLDFYKIELDGFINVSSNVDTIKGKIDTLKRLTNASEFGGSILTPLNSGQAYSMSFRGYFVSLKLMFISGVYVRYAAANRFWNYDKQSLSTTLSSFRTGIFHEFLRPNLRNGSSISIGMGFVYNTIRGDVDLSINDSFRKSILGVMKTDFTGYEFNTLFRLKNIKAEFAYTHFNGADNIPGLSSGRLVTTISFVGGFPIKLN